MAQSGLLPAVFARIHPRFGTPWASILIAGALHAALVTGSFEALLVIDVFLFVMSYLLIFAASVALRIKEPLLARPFKVPVGTGGMLVVAGVPALVGVLLLLANGVEYLIWGSLVAATGPLAYRLLSARAS